MISLRPQTLPDYVQLQRKAVKHLRLVIDRDASVRLVVPTRASQRAALQFFHSKQAWVEAKRAEVLAQHDKAERFSSLDSVLFRGQRYHLRYGAIADGIDHDQQQLLVAGEASAVARLRVWRTMAGHELRLRVAAEAERLAVTVNRVTVRDQKSRWGSCSAKGNISLNWRVALMPQAVGDYIIAHEFAHLRHMNHSSAFWAEAERLCPEYQHAERWIKAHGAPLMLLAR